MAGTKHKGEMILKNRTFLKGMFQYNTFVLADDGFDFFPDYGTHIKKIKEELIEKLTLAGVDTLLSSRDSTYFISINHTCSNNCLLVLFSYMIRQFM